MGPPRLSDFEVVEAPVPEPAEGEALVRSVLLSVDPGQRSQMRDPGSAYVVGSVVPGSALGRVERSRAPGVPEGALVRGRWGWTELAAVRGHQLDVLGEEPDIDPTAELGVLGVPGFTAYVGLLDIGRPERGETVFVSGAAGAVGSMVGQMAKIAGCTVVGSAGSDEKVAFVRSLGFDAAFNYKRVAPRQALAELCPEGPDLYFDNVGGDHLQAAVDTLREHGRIVACGSVSAYNDDGPGPALASIRRFVTHRLSMRGFVIWDHGERAAEHRADTLAWLRAGLLQAPTTLTEGIEATPAAFIAMLEGANTGKALVRV